MTPTPAPDDPSPPRVDRGDGKDAKGRFAPGNRLGRGNPLAGRAAKLRAELLAAITPQTIRAVVDRIVELALQGDLAACREVLDRCLGKPGPSDVLERLEALEAALANLNK